MAAPGAPGAALQGSREAYSAINAFRNDRGDSQARVEDILAVGDDGLRADVPLWLAATGPKAMRYAGAVADGMLMNVCLTTDYVKDKVPAYVEREFPGSPQTPVFSDETVRPPALIKP